jgi:polyphenol oxidase
MVVPRLTAAKTYAGADGLLTAVSGQPLGIFTADCVPIFLSAPSQGVVGLLHAGWRGVRGKILSKAVQIMRRRWRCSPKDIEIWAGPSIGPCCFEVRWDVAARFPFSRTRKGSRWIVDLQKELFEQARQLGIQKIRRVPICTQHTRTHHSYRRDKTEERQISIIYGIPQKTARSH